MFSNEYFHILPSQAHPWVGCRPVVSSLAVRSFAAIFNVYIFACLNISIIACLNISIFACLNISIFACLNICIFACFKRESCRTCMFEAPSVAEVEAIVLDRPRTETSDDISSNRYHCIRPTSH